MFLFRKVKNMLGGLLVIVVAVLIVLWAISNPGPEHIEDTNGADNFALQQITEQDVIAHSMGNRGGLTTSQTSWGFGSASLTDGVKYSCRKFTGVELLHTAMIFGGSDIYISLANFQVNSGNFAFYVILDGEVIGQVIPQGSGLTEFLIEDIETTGTLEYVIAGESADFQFVVPSEW